MKKESAFPFEEKHFGSDPSYHLGMSKRYWTAVMIAGALINNKAVERQARDQTIKDQFGSIAKTSYSIAEALIEQEDK